jgi:hypothetical protein
MRRRDVRVSPSPSSFAGFRFPPDVITLAVRWYLRYGLSYRDVEELLAERGIVVDQVTIYRWVQRFTPLLVDAARPCRHAPRHLAVRPTHRAPRGALLYSQHSWEELGGRFLGLMAYLRSKGQ